MFEKLSPAIRRFGWPMLAVWLVLLAAAGLAAKSLPDRLSGGGWYVPGSESSAVADELKSGFAGRAASNLTLVVRDERNTVASAEFTQRVSTVIRDVTSDPRLQVTGSYGWQTASVTTRSRFVAKDQRTVITQIALRLDDGTARRILPGVQRQIADRYEPQRLRVAFVSPASMFGEINKLSQDGLTSAELITFPLILIILLLLFRGIVAAAVSFVVAAMAIMFTFGTLSVMARHYELSIFVQNAATMIGLGVSVDYSLFIITRFSDELRQGRDRAAALATTLRTSGETVFFSGLIVVLATSSLFLVDLNVIRSLALGVDVVVAFAVVSSLLVLPIVLYLLGDRVLRGKLPVPRRPAESGRWAAVARQIMHRPLVFLAVAVAAMATLAVPALGMKTFTPDARIISSSSPVRFGFDAINEGFGQGSASPIQVVVKSRTPLDESAAAGSVLDLHDRLTRLKGAARVDSPVPVLRQTSPGRPFAALSPTAVAHLPADARATIDHYVSADRRTIVLEVIAHDTASGRRTLGLLDTIRRTTHALTGPEQRIDVGGEAAEGVDANKVIHDGLPRVLMTMLAIIYLLLLITFRSVFLPLKAILMNLLSIGATYGVLVLVFQRGVAADPLGLIHLDYLQNFVPIMLLALLVGLSTDYEVFLLNRIREIREAGADDRESVALGMARTAPLISGAAVLMVAVFGAFAFTGIMPIQQLGFGAALAIALDATVIRLIVVPASMRLLGAWNWWLPGRHKLRADPDPDSA
jgi:RND superfamily putative drug exporter